MQNITKKQSNSLYKMMKFTHDLLGKHKIDYWITGGTLLGAIRHSGLIPWDDDADICIMQKDVPKLRKIKSSFTRGGYTLSDDKECYKDKPKHLKNVCSWFLEPTDDPHGLGMDIFIMKEKGNKITFSDPGWETSENGGINCYFEKKHLFPLVPVHFGNFYVFAPNNAIEHLNKCYGEDWNSHSQMLYDHRKGKWINSKKKRMKAKEYQTISAPKTTCDSDPPNIGGCPLKRRSSSKRRSSPKHRSSKRSSSKRRSSSKKRREKLEKMTRQELYKLAQKQNISGRSGMTKSELIKNLILR